MSLNFGVELEVISGGGDVLSHLYSNGHVGDEYLHEYHCGTYGGGCPDCDPFRESPDWTAQEDCTADAEFISRVLTSHTPEADDALAALADALVVGRAEHDRGVGLHVHTDARPFDNNPDALVRLWRLWLCYSNDVAALARGNYGSIRTGESMNARTTDILGYNATSAEVERFFDSDTTTAYEMLSDTTRVGPRTSRWLSGGVSSGTFEFRIWNSTRSLWRIRLAAYVSVAMTQAALDGHDAAPDDGLNLLDVIGDYLPDDVFMAAFRQLIFVNA